MIFTITHTTCFPWLSNFEKKPKSNSLSNPWPDLHVIYKKKKTYITHMDDEHPVNFKIIQESAIATSDGYLQYKKKQVYFLILY